jgi:hypothetical protein
MHRQVTESCAGVQRPLNQQHCNTDSAGPRHTLAADHPVWVTCRARSYDIVGDEDRTWPATVGSFVTTRSLVAWPGRLQRAFSEMLSNTSTEWAPWHVIPADRKWFARLAAAAVIAHTLIEINPRFPKVDEDARRLLLEVKAELEGEAPAGAAQDPFAARV